MPADTNAAHQSLFSRDLLNANGFGMLFEPLGLDGLVPVDMLAAALAPQAAAIFAAPAAAALTVAHDGLADDAVANTVTAAPAIIAVDVAADTAAADAAASAAISAAVAAGLGGADQALLGNLARAASGVSGHGVVVGILSDSFNVRGGYAGDVSQGLLDAGVTVLKEGAAGSSDEGRAMAQLIHQVAPDAQIMFYSAFGGAADFANGIRALANAGASVIVDDVTYLNEPFYQDGGVIQAAVEQVVAAGVSYFTSASNQGDNFFESAFKPLYTGLPGLSGGFVAADFGTAGAPASTIGLTIAQGATVTLDLQWDEPFASIGGSAGAATSLGMVLYDAGGRIVAYALRSQIGGDPVELMQFKNSSASTSFRLAVITDGGRGVPGQFKFIAYGQGTSIADPRAGIGSGTIIGHEMVPEANTVGAVAYSQTHAFGGGNTLESFSSVGPGSFLFDAQGNRLATPLQGAGVDYVAPDGSSTSVFNPFYGTSAAAPNAAAVAALMLQNSPGLTPAQVSAILASSSVAASGAAAGTGAGLIQANAAVKAAIALAGPAGQSNSFTLAPAAPVAANTATSSAQIGSAQIGSAAAALTADVASQPAMLSDYLPSLDFASGLVMAQGDSLGGGSFANLALMNSYDPSADALFNPVHLVSSIG